MASLTQISITSRRVIRFGIYILILIIVGRFLFNIGVTIYKRIVPPAKPKPNAAFGNLPKIAFPDKPTPSNLNYTLELPEGGLPELLEVTDVYSMPTFEANIKALELAQEKAENLGFKAEGKRVVENIPNVYIFEKGNFPSKLTVNIVTGVFSISTNFEEDPTILDGLPPDAERAVEAAQDLLKSAELLTEDLTESPTTTQFIKYQSGQYNPVLSLSEANLTKVNIFRKTYGADSDIVSVTPDMPEANVWFMIAGGRGRQEVLGEYHYFPLDKSKVGTYPLKKADTAWEELKQGKGFIANPGQNPSGNIIIRKVYLAYYDASQYQKYYQPVIVFEGDNNFYAYVPAVTDEYYGKAE